MDGWIVVSIIVVGLGFIVARHMGLLAALSGRRGEFLVRQTLYSKLPRDQYLILDDVKLRFREAEVLIDHIVVSRNGLFLVESLHNAGRVDAAPAAAHWKCTRRRIRSRVVNPLRKNAVHQMALCESLQLSPALFHTMVVCTGSTSISGQKPDGVIRLGGLVPFIQIRNKIVLEHDEVYAIAESIEARRIEAVDPLMHLPATLRERLETASKRMNALRRILHIGVDRRDPVAGMVRTANGFVLAALLLTLALNAADKLDNQDDEPLMASMESNSNTVSPFADGPVSRAEVVAPHVGLSAADAQMQSMRQQLVQQELDRQLAWEASLSCSVDVRSGECNCRDRTGDPAPLSSEHCEYLARTSAPGD